MKFEEFQELAIVKISGNKLFSCARLTPKVDALRGNWLKRVVFNLYLNEAVKNILFRVKKDPGSPFVFPSKDGKPFDNVKRSL